MSDPHPTEGELAILRVLWGLGAPATVREVHDELLRSKDTAYTTVRSQVAGLLGKAGCRSQRELLARFAG
jgi:predicted transcriptional regulator